MNLLTPTVLLACYFFSSPALAADKVEVTQQPVDATEIVERLMIQAFRYKIETSPTIPVTGYIIQFEHWRLDELKQVQKSKVFELKPEDKAPSFFISFPVPPRMDVLVAPSGEDGEFRQTLKFSVTQVVDSTSEHLGKASIRPSEKGASVVLGYLLVGMAQGLDPKEVESDASADPLAASVRNYKKLLIDHKRSDVDMIVCRLIFQ